MNVSPNVTQNQHNLLTTYEACHHQGQKLCNMVANHATFNGARSGWAVLSIGEVRLRVEGWPTRAFCCGTWLKARATGKPVLTAWSSNLIGFVENAKSTRISTGKTMDSGVLREFFRAMYRIEIIRSKISCSLKTLEITREQWITCA